MAQITLNLADGSSITVPEWALETTQQDVLNEISKLVKQTGGTTAAQEKAARDTEKLLALQKKEAIEEKSRAKEQEKRDDKALQLDKDAKEAMDNLSDEMKKFKQDKNKSNFDKMIDDFEETGEQFGRGLLFMGEKALAVGAVLGTGILTGLGYVSNALLGAGDTLNELSDVGVGMNGTFAGVAQNATAGIAGLAGLTGSFGEAAELIKRNSNVVATQGFGRFRQSMDFASDVSEELGMSFSDSMEMFGEALERRQKSLNVQNVGQGALNRTIQTTIKSQRTYSMALGVSTEAIQSFVSGLTRNNGLLNSALLTMSDSIRNDVIGGIEVFASGMAGLGGQAGEDIATAMTEAAAAGSIGLSDSATAYITALPNLAGPMNEYIVAVKNGTLSQDQAKDMVTDLTMSLGNATAGEKQRIHAMALLGDQHAQTLSNAIVQFEQSQSKMADINKQLGTTFNMDAVQTGTNEFNKVLASAKGAFSNMFYSLFSNPQVTAALTDGLQDILAIFGFATDSVGNKAMDMGKTIEKYVPIVTSVVKGVVNTMKSLAEFFAQYINADGFDFSGLIGGMLSKALVGILKGLLIAVPLFIAGIFALGKAKMLFATTLQPAAEMFAKKMFHGAGGVAKKVGTMALGMMSSLMDSAKGGAAGAASKIKSVATTVDGATGGVMSKVGTSAATGTKNIFAKGKGLLQSKFGNVAGDGVGPTQSVTGKAKTALQDKLAGFSKRGEGVGSKVADKMKSFTDSGDKSTKAMSKAMSGGKGGPGFLDKIANGVKKFGDNKTVKGAQSLIMLGGALLITAVGLKTFNDVEWSSLVKGMLALGGLVALAKVMDKGSTAMIKGAAAIAVLGASLIPMALGLKIMNDVGIGTVFVMAAGLTALGVAAAVLGSFAPLMFIGAAAIAVLGASLIPFGIAMNIVALAMPKMTDSFEKLAKITWSQMLLAGPALLSLAAGMLALSGGGLVSSILDGIGSLFGADSPFDKIKMIGENAKHINKMSEEMRNMGDTVDGFTTALNNIDGSNIGSQFFLIADGLTALNTAVGNINLVSIAKLALLGAVMPGSTVGSVMPSSDNEEPQQVQPTTPTPTTTVNAGAIPVTGPRADDTEQRGRLGGPMQKRVAEMRAMRDQIPDDGTGKKQGTFKNGKLVDDNDDPALKTNELLEKVVARLDDANRTGKKQQRSIEGLEI